ncbi:hypothetical protein TSAR_005332, partial [Trichomalopsis sarcophagae]
MFPNVLIKFFCTMCNEDVYMHSNIINYLLCLDVEDSEHNLFNLGDINTSISFGEQTLILIGVIGSKETLSTENLRHYIAYTRKFNGSWLKISRLQKSEFNTKVALINYLLCLDVEDSEHNLFNLGDINTSISFGEQTLILIGVIGSKETLSTENLRHYIAYTRKFNGSWLKYDFKKNIPITE